MTEYDFHEVEPHGNSIICSEAKVGDCTVRYNEYGSFQIYTVAIGEIRHYDFPNRMPVAEFGMIEASTDYKPYHNPDCLIGSAIKGNELTGMRYRIGAVAPKSRDSVAIDGVHDEYVKADDIIAYLLERKEQVMASGESPPNPHRIIHASDWDRLVPGF